ncbi:uncharacterized protein [Ptychodera flava]|uniref:uncharacterized protein isoform X1 n=1 Tax=Ptychodera flava TaxID=63121 RepID=UPI00396A7745
MRTRDDVIYDEFTALVHYQADESPSTSRYFSHGMTFSIGHIRQYRAGELYTQGRFRNLISPLDDGLWHHVCHAWVGRIGTGRTWIYVDGTGVILGDLHYEHMAGGGTVYLGRATHSLDVHKPFIGEMTEFYMFDVKLDEQVIAWMVQNCSGNDVAGALIHWPTIIRENRYMAVNIIKEVTDVCGRPGCRLESCMVGGACLENQSQGINGETCICANLENTCPADQTSSKYVLGSTSRVSLSNAGVTRNLSAFTFCLWTKTATTGNSVTTIFEFEASGSSDASNIKSVYIDHSYLLVTKYDDEQHQVSSRIGSGPGRVNDGSWHLLCVTGTLSDEASFHIYRDGIQITRSLYRQELQLHAMGTVRLGFSPMKPDHYAFRGDVYGFHM